MTSPRDILFKYWGYDDFRPMQAEIIDSVLGGHDTLGLLPTGGGKSVTFQVPAMMLPGLTLVVTPLISLMKDQVDNLRLRYIPAGCLHTGMTRAEINLTLDKCRLGKYKILYLSPERLRSGRFIDNVREWDVSLIVVDEAHCISQWGYDFRPSYLEICTLREIFPDVTVLALTASATPQVAADICSCLHFRPGSATYSLSFSRDNLSYIVRYDEYKERTLINILSAVPGSAIVYVRSRRRTRELAQMLQSQGFEAEFYHAGLDPRLKEQKQNEWKSGEKRIIVATNAFGMGIDKPDVRVVVHFDLPSSLEEYYQEAGRAGRDGKPAFAVVIAAKSDKALLSRRLSEAFPSKDFIRTVYEKACNFMDIAIGGGYDTIHEFDYNLFCQRFGLPPAMTYSALGILTRAHYLEFVDDAASRSRVMIIADKQELYSLNLDPVSDRIFLELQRAYTGLFANYVNIDEEIIAIRASASAQQVYDTMLLLSRMHVLSYIPKSDMPYVYIPTSREEPRYLLFPREIYEYRRQAMAERIDAMKRFVFDSTRCRSVVMLEYFGEKNPQDCGRCDVCRSAGVSFLRKKDVDSAELTALVVASAKRGCTMAQIIDAVATDPDFRSAFSSTAEARDGAIEIIRDLIDRGQLVI